MPFKNGTLDYALKLPYALEKLGLEVGPPCDYRDIMIEKSIRFLYSFWPNQLTIHQLIVHA